MPLLFVYGSLKRGFSAEHLLDGEFVAEAKTEPVYQMLQFGAYPGVIAADEGGYSIEGEIWDVSEGCIPMLDEYEGVAEGAYLRVAAKLAEPHQQLQRVSSFTSATRTLQIVSI